MSRILKILIFIIGVILFFEVGLFASYSVISSGPVNPGELISMQADSVSDLFGSVTGNKKLSDQDNLNVTNKEDVAMVLDNMTNLSTSLDSVTAKVSSDDTGNQTVTLTAIASKDIQGTSGGVLTIVPEQKYSITATAIGTVYSNGKVKINTTSITLKERIVLYNQNNTGNLNVSQNATINDLVNYTTNASNLSDADRNNSELKKIK